MKTIIPILLFASLTLMSCISQFGAGLKVSADRTAAVLQTVIPAESPNQASTTQATPTPQSSRNDAEHLTLYELTDEGFSISLPDDWRSFDMAETDFAETLQALGNQNEGLEQIFTNEYFQSLIASGIKFYALNVSDDSLRSETPASINIIRQELPLALTVDEYATLASGQLAQFFDLTSEVEQAAIRLGDRDAVKLSYSASLIGPFGNPMEIANTQYIIIDGLNAYIVTIGMTIDLVDTYQLQYLEAVETFRLVE